jgi:hypothetical protein
VAGDVHPPLGSPSPLEPLCGPPNARKLKQLRRRLDKVLARIEKEIT